MIMKNYKLPLCIVLLTGIMMAGNSYAASQPVGVVSAPDENANNIPAAAVQRFASAMQIIKRYYVKPISNEDLLNNALRGMLNELDPHSTYLDAEELADLKDMTSGQFSGLGIEVTPDNGYIKIISPIDEGPAQKAGIKPGDYIIRIDGSLVNKMTLREAVKKMRGPAGSQVRITIARKGEKQPLELKLTRDDIRVQSVKSRLLDANYGYIRISVFQGQTSGEFIKAITALQQKANGRLRGIILDLRNDPGGLLDAAVDVCDSLLDSSKLKYRHVIVYTKARLPTSQLSAKATGTDLLRGAPIVVLINEGSASASEIVAGALQDHKRALIVGKTSFGKGSVQTVIPLDANSAVKITTALYYTPAGRSIQAEGIKPDVIIDDIKVPNSVEDTTDELSYIKEADLKGHLPNSKQDKASLANTTVPTAADDYQLFEAYNLLKGMSLLHPVVVTDENKEGAN